MSALDALLQHLPSYFSFSYLGCGVSLHSCSIKAQRLLLTLDEGYLLMAAPPDLELGVAPLGPPAPSQPPLLGPNQSALLEEADGHKGPLLLPKLRFLRGPVAGRKSTLGCFIGRHNFRLKKMYNLRVVSYVLFGEK